MLAHAQARQQLLHMHRWEQLQAAAARACFSSGCSLGIEVGLHAYSQHSRGARAGFP
jgi:hypothetical protein